MKFISLTFFFIFLCVKPSFGAGAIYNSDYFKLPDQANANRSSFAAGQLGYNIDTKAPEFWNGTAWLGLGGGSLDPTGNYVWTGSWTFNGPLIFGNPSTVRSALGAAASAHDLNIEDNYGAKADTLQATCIMTTQAGSTAFTMTGCKNYVIPSVNIVPPLSSANVGKPIEVNYAGASLTTSPITALTLATHGSAYLGVPSITISDATGTGAYAIPIMEVATISLVDGGKGCTDGAQTFTVVGGTGSLNITDITTDNPSVVQTATPHGFTNGQIVTLIGTKYIDPNNVITGVPLTITVIDANDFSIGVDGSGLGSYTGGAVVQSPATITATSTAGVVSGGTITYAGLYQALQTPGSVLYPPQVQVTGGGCSTPPVYALTFDVATVSLVAGGQNYTAPTAAITGNATLNAPTLGTPVALPLSTTVATVVDSTHGTFAAPASQTLNAVSEMVVFGGTDNQPFIQAAMNDQAAVGLSGSPVKVPAPRPGYCYGIGSPLVQPDTYPITMIGSSGGLMNICALNPMSAMMTKGSTFYASGSHFIGLNFEGFKLPTTIFSGSCMTQQVWENIRFMDAAPYGTDDQFGDGVRSCADAKMYNVVAYQDKNIYTGHYDLPLNGHIVSNTDTTWYGEEAIEVSNIGWQAGAKGSDAHNYGGHSFGLDRMTTCFDIANIEDELNGTRCDLAAVSVIDVHDGTTTIGGGHLTVVVHSVSIPTQFGVRVDSGLNKVRIQNFDATRIPLPQNRVVWAGPIGSYNVSLTNPGAWPEFSWGVDSVLCSVAATAPLGVVTATTEIVVADCLLPAGIAGPNGWIRASGAVSVAGTGTGDVIKGRYGPVTTAIGTMQQVFSSGSKSSNTFNSYTFDQIIQGTNSLTNIRNAFGAGAGFSTTSVAAITANPAVISDLFLTLTAVSGDTNQLNSLNVTVHPQ